ncbi:hypothetical protein EYF80_001666 [Liparis tanakae]|uniref:Uncharacterized protein n=1 Tax=Liparis tanakae TaxID=230148 RepID=A0A4Z2JCR2_9TELE|nr:hypothetical protein EYF80_001666 [Liparis tanakae]
MKRQETTGYEDADRAPEKREGREGLPFSPPGVELQGGALGEGNGWKVGGKERGSRTLEGERFLLESLQICSYSKENRQQASGATNCTNTTAEKLQQGPPMEVARSQWDAADPATLIVEVNPCKAISLRGIRGAASHRPSEHNKASVERFLLKAAGVSGPAPILSKNSRQLYTAGGRRSLLLCNWTVIDGGADGIATGPPRPPGARVAGAPLIYSLLLRIAWSVGSREKQWAS